MATISRTGIQDGLTSKAEHITRIIDALDGTATTEVVATGSFTGSFTGDGSALTVVSAANKINLPFVTVRNENLSDEAHRLSDSLKKDLGFRVPVIVLAGDVTYKTMNQKELLDIINSD